MHAGRAVRRPKRNLEPGFASSKCAGIEIAGAGQSDLAQEKRAKGCRRYQRLATVDASTVWLLRPISPPVPSGLALPSRWMHHLRFVIRCPLVA
jgi:hypothetical protein